MTFDAVVREQLDQLTDPLAALVALTDLELETLPADDRKALLSLVREHALQASLIASELRVQTWRPERGDEPGIEIDLRDRKPGTPFAA